MLGIELIYWIEFVLFLWMLLLSSIVVGNSKKIADVTDRESRKETKQMLKDSGVDQQ